MAQHKWYQAGLRFECTQCGNCCSGDPGYVWVTKDDIGRISRFLSLPDADRPDRRYFRRVRFRHSLREKPDGDCVFLKREAGKALCVIYAVRPLQCRTWPFWALNLRSSEMWNEAHRKCPGMGSGRHYGLAQIEALRTQKSW